MPLVSVIIPTYNHRGMLQKTIDSVLAQTYKDVEIIVVDDNNPGSEGRGKTESLMASYAANPNVIYLKHEHNKNGSAARNTGFWASKGDYIAFLDDDDYWEKDKIEKQLSFLQTHPQHDAVYCYTYVGGGAKNPNRCKEGNIVVDYLTN